MSDHTHTHTPHYTHIHVPHATHTHVPHTHTTHTPKAHKASGQQNRGHEPGTHFQAEAGTLNPTTAGDGLGAPAEHGGEQMGSLSRAPAPAEMRPRAAERPAHGLAVRLLILTRPGLPQLLAGEVPIPSLALPAILGSLT